MNIIKWSIYARYNTVIIVGEVQKPNCSKLNIKGQTIYCVTAR